MPVTEQAVAWVRFSRGANLAAEEQPSKPVFARICSGSSQGRDRCGPFRLVVTFRDPLAASLGRRYRAILDFPSSHRSGVDPRCENAGQAVHMRRLDEWIAVAAGYAGAVLIGVQMEQVRSAFSHLVPSPEQAPGS